MYIDVENLVPVCIEAFDWNGQRTSQYVYSNVRLNVGLGSKDFEPEACGIGRP